MTKQSGSIPSSSSLPESSTGKELLRHVDQEKTAGNGESLEAMLLAVEGSFEQLKEAQKASLGAAASLSGTIEAWKLQQIEAKLDLIRRAVGRWESEWDTWEKVIGSVITQLADEVEIRHDLQLDGRTSMLLTKGVPEESQPTEVMGGFTSLIEQVLNYDSEKRVALNRLDEIKSAIVSLRQDISEWTQEAQPEIAIAPDVEVDEARITLSEVHKTIERVAVEKQELESQCAQLRELALNRIVEIAGRLQEYEVPDDTAIEHDLSLADLTSDLLSSLPPHQLMELELMLEMLLNEQILRAKASAPNKLAEQLRETWSDDKLMDLLEGLAKQKRDIETLLLVLTANAAHPRAQQIAFAHTIVASLLRGVEQLAKAQPFGLLNSLAPDLLNGWEANVPESQVELCMVMLAAQYGGGRNLPAGFLWQLPIEWPISGMPSWETVWEAALQDEPMPITSDSREQDWSERLDRARSQARQMLSREHGFFVRLNSLRSRRHQTMMNSQMMPELLSQLEFLEAIEQRLQGDDPEQSASALAELESALAGGQGTSAGIRARPVALDSTLSEDALLERYEAAILDEAIDDSDTFHRRTALRILQDCGECIMEYAQSLLGFWRVRLRPEASVTSETLQQELTRLHDLTPLGRTAVKQLLQNADTDLVEWNAAAARSHSSHLVVHELLGQGTYVLRLPRLTAHLTQHRLEWSELSQSLLDDLALPLEPVEAAEMLLEHDAPNQVLLIAQYLPLDMQKEAQALKGECEREFENGETELLREGGDSKDLIEDRNLGRWQLVRRVLMERLTELQIVREEDERRLHERETEVRSRINQADDAIFGVRRTMPVEAYRLVQEGFALARTAITNEALHGAIDAYLREVSYRHEHESWPVTELQKMNALLQSALVGESQVSSQGLTAERVLELLEQEDLRPLGCGPNDVVASEVETRSDLLRSWLAVRDLPGFLSNQLSSSDRTIIERLFASFAQMTALRYARSPDGKRLAFNEPTIYSIWELQYPKTATLRRECVLIALPGRPPSASNISQLERLLTEKDWLPYFFVILFAPGCTPKIRQRLLSSYHARGLLIVDEDAILDMVIAERRSTNPLGRLRPMMLNARAAENVSVFEINHVVNAQTSIFVGREPLVQRISSSGANFALYGGRRIGKSSILTAIETRLKRQGVRVVLQSLDGWDDCSDDASARNLGREMGLQQDISQVGDLRLAIQEQLEEDSSLRLVLLLDEVDRYIQANPSRHVLIETLRALSDHYGDRFRVVIAGFMALHDCLHGRGPYSAASDPWARMLNDLGPVRNLRPTSAEQIVREGFLAILGWEFESRAIPQRIVERTGGHPAFVQCFCRKLQELVGVRGDRHIRLEDVEAVFDDQDPVHSFIAYVKDTLRMNLQDPITQYLIPWLAVESSEAKGFTLGQIQQLAEMLDPPIPEVHLSRSLERLVVTSVVRARAAGVYEFSVPDYPSILKRLGYTEEVDRLEDKLKKYLKSEAAGVTK